jgi:hypothetical protein
MNAKTVTFVSFGNACNLFLQVVKRISPDLELTEINNE